MKPRLRAPTRAVVAASSAPARGPRHAAGVDRFGAGRRSFGP